MWHSYNTQGTLIHHAGRKLWSVIENCNAVQEWDRTKINPCRLEEVIQELWLREIMGNDCLSGEMLSGHGIEYNGSLFFFSSFIYVRWQSLYSYRTYGTLSQRMWNCMPNRWRNNVLFKTAVSECKMIIVLFYRKACTDGFHYKAIYRRRQNVALEELNCLSFCIFT